MDEKLGFDEIKKTLTKSLKLILDVYEYKITFARQLPDRWLINVSFKEKNDVGSEWTRTAAISINAMTGELIEVTKNVSYS